MHDDDPKLAISVSVGYDRNLFSGTHRCTEIEVPEIARIQILV
jgi:hypothetical protein